MFIEIADTVEGLIQPNIVKIDGFPIGAVSQPGNKWAVLDKRLNVH
jgi:hypothetical protein